MDKMEDKKWQKVFEKMRELRNGNGSFDWFRHRNFIIIGAIRDSIVRNYTRRT